MQIQSLAGQNLQCAKGQEPRQQNCPTSDISGRLQRLVDVDPLRVGAAETPPRVHRGGAAAPWQVGGRHHVDLGVEGAAAAPDQEPVCEAGQAEGESVCV